ncbi:hypothetical protein B0H13DRAFT_1853128 [Mycena leptocephala]|nr:hypothetical protein B0H13DRAFT_1853128 [Mycena leptocephala]
MPARVRRSPDSCFISMLTSSHSAHQLPFPPPRRTPLRIIKSADQQASIFIHQKLKVRVCVNANDAFVAQGAGPEERTRIVDAICGSISATGPFSAVSKPPRALRNARPHRRPRDKLLGVLRHPESSGLRRRGGLLADWFGAASGRSGDELVNKHASHVWSKVIVGCILSNL